jgi:hypothetical protein
MDPAAKSLESTIRGRNQHLSFFFDNKKVLGFLMIAPAVIYILALVGYPLASVTSPWAVHTTALSVWKICAASSKILNSKPH